MVSSAEGIKSEQKGGGGVIIDPKGAVDASYKFRLLEQPGSYAKYEQDSSF